MNYWHKTMDQGPADTGYPDYEPRAQCLTDSGKTVDYLVSLGVPFLPDILRSLRRHTVANVDGRGAGWSPRWRRRVRAKGVEILTDCKAESLVTDDAGAVIGVKATTPTEDISISARSVVLATGGIQQQPRDGKGVQPGDRAGGAAVRGRQHRRRHLDGRGHRGRAL